MKVLIDLNIFIDVLQKRQEFLKASLQIVKQALTGKLTGCLPAHSVTTGVYICSCHGNGTRKDDALSLILDKRIAVIPCDRKILLEARKLGFADHEDAVVAVSAKKARCKYIITRNVKDFAGSPVPAITPADFLAL